MNTVNFSITNNHAPEGGDNIYGDLSFCYNSKLSSKAAYFPQNNVNQPSSISSNPHQVCLNDSKFACDLAIDVPVYPGQKVVLPIRMVGELNGSVSGTVSASTTGGAAINATEKAQEVGISGKNITYTVYSSQAYNTPKAYIYLQPVKYGCNVKSVISTIEISFSDCPFGFDNTNIDPGGNGVFRCQCSPNPVIASFSIDSQTITKIKFPGLARQPFLLGR